MLILLLSGIREVENPLHGLFFRVEYPNAEIISGTE